MERRIVITGLGAITPIGLSKDEFWTAALKGKNGVGKITRFNTDDFSVKIAAEIQDFDPSKYLSPKEIRRTDRFVQFAIAASLDAIADTKLYLEKEDPTKIGVIIASGIGGIETWETEFKKLAVSPRRVSPLFVPMMVINMASGEVAIRVGAKGPNFAIVSACASGAHAIGEAYRIIKTGDADIMIAGGSEAPITPLCVAGFSNMKALSTRNDEPEKSSRPFARDRDGFIVGEGAGVCILEELEHALARNAPIYCEMVGCGMTCDAYHITAPDPLGEQPARAMKLAMEQGNLSCNEIDYINAHGTSTQLNDRAETNAIKKTFGKYAKRVSISSTKSMIGHLLGATGGVEFIATVLSVKQGIIHPTRNLDNPDPECDLDYTAHTSRKIEVRAALSNSFGFGGHNITLAIRKF